MDGVYSDDPEKNPHAILYRELDYDTVIEKNLKVMDSTALLSAERTASLFSSLTSKRTETL